MARKERLSEEDTLNTQSYEDTVLYQDAEGKGAVLGTLDAPDNSKKNKDTIKGTAGQEPADGDLQGVREDIFSEIFDGEGLSETFKSKFKGIFEAELGRRTGVLEEQIKENFQQELDEKVSEVVEGLSQKVDEYLNYVVENWMKENELAVETGMRLQIAESFTVPDSKVNVLDEMFEKTESYKKELDEALDINSQLLTVVESYRKNDIATQISEGLTDLEKEKFVSLSEDVSYENDEEYVQKLTAIRESYFKRSAPAKTVSDDVDVHEPSKFIAEGNEVMNRYVQAIEKHR